MKDGSIHESPRMIIASTAAVSLVVAATLAVLPMVHSPRSAVSRTTEPQPAPVLVATKPTVAAPVPVATKPAVVATVPVVVVAPTQPATVPTVKYVKRPSVLRDAGGAVMSGMPEIVKRKVPSVGVSDEEIGQAITRGVDWLLRRFDKNGLLVDERRDGDYLEGLNALAVYALLQSAWAIEDPRLNLQGATMRQMLQQMKSHKMSGQYSVYARGIRSTALALNNRREDRNDLRADATWLVGSSVNGSYTYGRSMMPESFRGSIGDNSNSQYGLLGVWSAAEAGIEVPGAYWSGVQRHWTSGQLADGTWGYTVGDQRGTLPMTLAGIASLFVAHDYLDAGKYATANPGTIAFPEPLARGLAYLEKNPASLSAWTRSGYWGYAAYGIERVGLASGLKQFGDVDWYRDMSGRLVELQNADGSFPDDIPQGRGPVRGVNRGDVANTAYALLFLSRGRHPVVMNKLRFEGNWHNRPRDVSNLAKFVGTAVERQLNWQIVAAQQVDAGGRDYNDWMDSPILYIASHTAPKLTDQTVEQLRRYVEAGGLIFTHADGGSEEFNAYVEQLVKRVAPGRELEAVPEDHALYTLVFRPAKKPALKMVTNGVRPLLIHSPTDIAAAWQGRLLASRKEAFEVGTNMFVFATGKTAARNRLAVAAIPDSPWPASGTIPVARVTYAGNWNPEPAGWGRFGRWMRWETSLAVTTQDVDAARLDARQTPVAHLTGVGRVDLSPAQRAGLRKFVTDGGLLLVDAAGGSEKFDEWFREQLMLRDLAGSEGERAIASHPLRRGDVVPGMEDLSILRMRPYVAAAGRDGKPPLDVRRLGKGVVVYSALDISQGLLGTSMWGVAGYEPDAARRLLKNALLWAAAGYPGLAAVEE